MANVYEIYGAEMSPYSVKVRSYFRYKAIPHQWILRNAEGQAEYATELVKTLQKQGLRVESDLRNVKITY